jgi:hypothetical protein
VTEHLMDKRCGGENVRVLTVSTDSETRVGQAIERLRDPVALKQAVDRTAGVLLISSLRMVESDVQYVDLDVCPFEGKVTVQVIDSDDVHVWTCPLCRTENRELDMA